MTVRPPRPTDPRSIEATNGELDSASRWKRRLLGKPRDLSDRSIFRHLSLVPFLAWVGLGADGLSSSAYGPEEAFRTLGEHTYLAIGLAVLTTTTVLVIASAYSRIIEHFPHGGGGYVVATKQLGPSVGVVSGCALLVDYVLTITVSIAAAGDAMFSFIPIGWHEAKLPLEVLLIVLLITLNLRGVRESVLVLTPIFLVFVVTHVLLIGGGLFTHLADLPAVAGEMSDGFSHGWSTLGFAGMLLLLVHAYSLGGGTYTGIEAVSNGLAIMREPRERTAKRTMLYMAVSLAFTAAGLLVCYLLLHVRPVTGKTLNAVLAEALAGGSASGVAFVLTTILSEGALLVVAAQAGFLDGPRVLANMALDSWVPRRFAALSDRLTTQNGILLMGVSSIIALLYTHGEVRQLVVMYSINVFLTFSLSMLSMLHGYWKGQFTSTNVRRRVTLFAIGFVMCVTILAITVFEKFTAGGWITLLVTGGLVVECGLVRRHYHAVGREFAQIDRQLKKLELLTVAPKDSEKPLDPAQPTAILLTSSYSGVGIHTMMHIHRAFTGHFHNFVFISIGAIDSGAFKGQQELEALRRSTQENLDNYVRLAGKMGFPATSRLAIATDVVKAVEELCVETAREFPRSVVFSGQIIFENERWYHRPLHNQTAYAIQKRLQFRGMTMVILPVRLHTRV